MWIKNDCGAYLNLDTITSIYVVDFHDEFMVEASGCSGEEFIIRSKFLTKEDAQLCLDRLLSRLTEW